MPTIPMNGQPVDAMVIPGSTARFTVAAVGDLLTFQWFMVVDDGDDISLNNDENGIFGVTNENLFVTSVTEASHEGEMYYVRVSNPAGFIFSNRATLIVSKLLNSEHMCMYPIRNSCR